MSFISTGFLLWKSNLAPTPTNAIVTYQEPEIVDVSVDTEAIKDVLRSQQQLLHTLYAELDEEREASSSAANEAMSMILRLQADKARLKLEASQYMREAEEKMCLAEETLANFEEIIYQKEAELASLEHQVECYKAKLIELGCTDLSIPEFEWPDSPQQSSTRSNDQEIVPHRSNAIVTTPPIAPIKDNYFSKKRAIETKRSTIPIPKKPITNTGDLNLYWEHIRKLDEQVKKITNYDQIPRREIGASLRNRFRSSSVPPPETEDDSSLPSSPPVYGTLDRVLKMHNMLPPTVASSASHAQYI